MSVKTRLWLGFASNLIVYPLQIAIMQWSINASWTEISHGTALINQGRNGEQVQRLVFSALRSSSSRGPAAAQQLLAATEKLENNPSAEFTNEVRGITAQIRELVPVVASGTIDPASDATISSIANRLTELSTKTWNAYDDTQRILHEVETGTKIRVGALLMATMLFTILASFFIARSITKPLEELTAASRRIGEGDMSQKVVLPRDVELRALAETFNAMRDRLSDLISKLKNHAQGASMTATSIMAASMQMSDGAKQQSAATEETSSAMEEIAAQIQGVSHNAVELANDASGAASSAKRIGGAAETVSRAAQDLFSALERGVSNVEAVANLAQQSSGDLSNVEQFARQINTEAESGGEALDNSIHKVQEIGQATLTTSKAFEDLDQRSRQITGIVETMAEIADQTNILSLNAAIEAARAGDSGRGFAVVAEEVRKLAERSLSAAKEVAQLIGDIRNEIDKAVTFARQNAERTSEGATLLTETGGRMKKVVDSVRRVSELVSKVSLAVTSQSSSANELKREMERLRGLSSVLSQNANSQTSGAAEVVQAVERISSRTRQVADATVQVRAGGDQVVKSAENISLIARQNQDVVHKVSAEMQALISRVGELQEQAAALRMEQSA
jgi:methyl-accepting chemotaxis protein